MNIFIAGGGRVGFHLARLLSIENHNVTVIEKDPNQVEQVDYALDCRTVQGDAASAILLTELGVDSADVFISLTGTDEINLISAATAKGLGAGQVVARVDRAAYFESNMLYETILGIDYILSPDALTALEIARYIENPGMVATEDFGRGRVQMRQMRVTKSPAPEGSTLKDVRMPSGTLVAVVIRDGKKMIPHGDSTIEPGDMVAFVGIPEQLQKVQHLFKGEEPKPERIIIMGGSTIGQHLAQVLESRQESVKLIDWNLQKCNEIATKLKKTKVVCRDATSRVSLDQEHVGSVDLFVATTSDDERNIMASLLAKEVGAKQTICVVHQPDFASLVGKLGIDHAVTPRASMANRILRLVHQKNVSTVAVIDDGEIEILEMALKKNANCLNKPLREIRLPKGALIATILRGDEVIVPRGENELHEGDSIIVIVTADSIEAVEKLFLR